MALRMQNYTCSYCTWRGDPWMMIVVHIYVDEIIIPFGKCSCLKSIFWDGTLEGHLPAHPTSPRSPMVERKNEQTEQHYCSPSQRGFSVPDCTVHKKGDDACGTVECSLAWRPDGTRCEKLSYHCGSNRKVSEKCKGLCFGFWVELGQWVSREHVVYYASIRSHAEILMP